MGDEKLQKRCGGVPCSQNFEIIGMSLAYFDSFDSTCPAVNQPVSQFNA